jgi:hypothetical protein
VTASSAHPTHEGRPSNGGPLDGKASIATGAATSLCRTVAQPRPEEGARAKLADPSVSDAGQTADRIRVGGDVYRNGVVRCFKHAIPVLRRAWEPMGVPASNTAHRDSLIVDSGRSVIPA